MTSDTFLPTKLWCFALFLTETYSNSCLEEKIAEYVHGVYFCIQSQNILVA